MVIDDNRKKNSTYDCSEESFAVRLTEPMLHDRLSNLSTEYSVSKELLVNVAVKRLLDDVDFVRNLRIGKIESE